MTMKISNAGVGSKGKFGNHQTSSSVGFYDSASEKFAFTPEPEGLDELKTPYERLFGSKEVREEYDKAKRFWQGLDHRPIFAVNGVSNGVTVSGFDPWSILNQSFFGNGRSVIDMTNSDD